MKRRLTLMFVAAASLTVVAVAPATVPAAGAQAAAVRHCRHVDVNFKPDGAGGGMNILAWNVGCRKARQVVRHCIKGTVDTGWTATANSDYSRITMRSGKRKIEFMPVGGGGCVPV